MESNLLSNKTAKGPVKMESDYYKFGYIKNLYVYVSIFFKVKELVFFINLAIFHRFHITSNVH